MNRSGQRTLVWNENGTPEPFVFFEEKGILFLPVLVKGSKTKWEWQVVQVKNIPDDRPSNSPTT